MSNLRDRFNALPEEELRRYLATAESWAFEPRRAYVAWLEEQADAERAKAERLAAYGRAVNRFACRLNARQFAALADQTGTVEMDSTDWLLFVQVIRRGTELQIEDLGEETP